VTEHAGRRRRDNGAAAVEFALVVPILLLLVFGLIDYGLYFSDSLGARDGARVAARRGVVAGFPTDACAGNPTASGDAQLQQLACLAVNQANPVGGVAYARVINPTDWDRGEDLLVCVAVVVEGLTGYVPMPNDATVRASLRMRIEQPTTPAKAARTVGEARTSSATDPPAAGFWSSWCV
jgi:Flp pilus assembly protein TadG